MRARENRSIRRHTIEFHPTPSSRVRAISRLDRRNAIDHVVVAVSTSLLYDFLALSIGRRDKRKTSKRFASRAERRRLWWRRRYVYLCVTAAVAATMDVNTRETYDTSTSKLPTSLSNIIAIRRRRPNSYERLLWLVIVDVVTAPM